ncbi:hypothetical protein ACHAWF_017138 [Thalassiosira exigua]
MMVVADERAANDVGNLGGSRWLDDDGRVRPGPVVARRRESTGSSIANDDSLHPANNRRGSMGSMSFVNRRGSIGSSLRATCELTGADCPDNLLPAPIPKSIVLESRDSARRLRSSAITTSDCEQSRQGGFLESGRCVDSRDAHNASTATGSNANLDAPLDKSEHSPSKCATGATDLASESSGDSSLRTSCSLISLHSLDREDGASRSKSKPSIPVSISVERTLSLQEVLALHSTAPVDAAECDQESDNAGGGAATDPERQAGYERLLRILLDVPDDNDIAGLAAEPLPFAVPNRSTSDMGRATAPMAVPNGSPSAAKKPNSQDEGLRGCTEKDNASAQPGGLLVEWGEPISSEDEEDKEAEEEEEEKRPCPVEGRTSYVPYIRSILPNLWRSFVASFAKEVQDRRVPSTPGGRRRTM